MSADYTYMWEYIVAPEQVGAFEHIYGPQGQWAMLFRRAPGYLRTELHRDHGKSPRFITIDYWETKAAWEAFRSRYAEEFETLDAACEALTTRETEIGRFRLVD